MKGLSPCVPAAATPSGFRGEILNLSTYSVHTHTLKGRAPGDPALLCSHERELERERVAREREQNMDLVLEERSFTNMHRIKRGSNKTRNGRNNREFIEINLNFHYFIQLVLSGDWTCQSQGPCYHQRLLMEIFIFGFST